MPCKTINCSSPVLHRKFTKLPNCFFTHFKIANQSDYLEIQKVSRFLSDAIIQLDSKSTEGWKPKMTVDFILIIFVRITVSYKDHCFFSRWVFLNQWFCIEFIFQRSVSPVSSNLASLKWNDKSHYIFKIIISDYKKHENWTNKTKEKKYSKTNIFIKHKRPIKFRMNEVSLINPRYIFCC